MAQNTNKTTKLLIIVLAVVIIAGIIILLFVYGVFDKKNSSDIQNNDTAITKEASGETLINEDQDQPVDVTLSAQEEYEIMLQDENFISVFNNFGYDSSIVKDARYVEQDGSMFYILLEAEDSFNEIDSFYKTKKVQSTWKRAEIFETGSKNLEESFLSNESLQDESEEYYKYSKYSYSSEDKDQVLNVLIKSFEENTSQILIIYWQLSK